MIICSYVLSNYYSSKAVFIAKNKNIEYRLREVNVSGGGSKAAVTDGHDQPTLWKQEPDTTLSHGNWSLLETPGHSLCHFGATRYFASLHFLRL